MPVWILLLRIDGGKRCIQHIEQKEASETDGKSPRPRLVPGTPQAEFYVLFGFAATLLADRVTAIPFKSGSLD